MLLLGKPWHYSAEILPTHTFFSFIQLIVRKPYPCKRNWRRSSKSSWWLAWEHSLHLACAEGPCHLSMGFLWGVAVYGVWAPSSSCHSPEGMRQAGGDNWNNWGAKDVSMHTLVTSKQHLWSPCGARCHLRQCPETESKKMQHPFFFSSSSSYSLRHMYQCWFANTSEER